MPVKTRGTAIVPHVGLSGVRGFLRTHILAKLGVKSRSAAADYAHRHGLA